jgi:HD-GYP domain-containing protein (c-di-GMP phosphodiesterase class II)
VRLQVQFLLPGMKIFAPVYGPKGELLLPKRAILTEANIAKLRQHNILAVYIETDLVVDHIENLIDDLIRVETQALVREWAEKHGDHKLFQGIKKNVKQIVSDVISGKTVQYGLAEIYAGRAYTYAHSVDVCILAIMAGYRLNYSRPALLDLAIGSLLHDLGKAKLDKMILNKPGKLTDMEMSGVRRHPELGFQMLIQHEDISPVAGGVVLSHHERLDGSGYPFGLKDNAIPRSATICAIADVYNALTTDRVYRKAIPPGAAYEILEGSEDRLFPSWAVKAFLKCVVPYPVGTLTRLSTGDMACVVAVNPLSPLQPKVVLPETKTRLDLAQECDIQIAGCSSEREIQRLLDHAIRCCDF